ncbi:TPM domain-containing protein [Mycobacterium marseillense]|uniref:TPM domain-containing protein n=1 Tax=Mycobacterium marseillense TaxID=701042 RepID=UPI00259AA965|nr:TPM domain-containing protein [Mycobacterium marseillense]MDM3973794.1 TPM domain-containing protein [Mycobacterium marseillense]
MRVVRLFGAVLTILTAGLLLASPAGAQPPSQLRDHITDTTGALTDPGREAVSSAIDRLYRDRHIQLWVVYVDNFSRYKPDNWAAGTRSASGLGGQDALLAIATNTKAYSFTVPPQVQGPTAASLNSLRRNQIEPVLGAKDWSGAAVAAADGLDKLASSAKPASPSKPIWPLVAIGVIVVVLVVLLFVLYRARRRRRALGGGHVEGREDSLAQALSTADARVRQISDYVARHRDSVGSEAQARLDEAKRHVAAAHGKESTNDAEAIAHANRASTLAAQAQTLANDNVLGRQGARRGRSRQR